MSNLATAMAIQEATSESIHDEMVMTFAREMLDGITYGNIQDEHIRLLFQYSAMLASATATRITSVLLTESQFNNMVDEINEMENLTNDIVGE